MAEEALGIRINEFYGQTECNLVLSDCQAIMLAKADSMGRPVPGQRVAVVGEGGDALPAGEVREVGIRRPDPTMMLGYCNNEAATEARSPGTGC